MPSQSIFKKIEYYSLKEFTDSFNKDILGIIESYYQPIKEIELNENFKFISIFKEYFFIIRNESDYSQTKKMYIYNYKSGKIIEVLYYNSIIHIEIFDGKVLLIYDTEDNLKIINLVFFIIDLETGYELNTPLYLIEKYDDIYGVFTIYGKYKDTKLPHYQLQNGIEYEKYKFKKKIITVTSNNLKIKI